MPALVESRRAPGMRSLELIEQALVGRSYDYADEFEYGLELVLDGLEARLADGSAGSVAR